MCAKPDDMACVLPPPGERPLVPLSESLVTDVSLSAACTWFYHTRNRHTLTPPKLPLVKANDSICVQGHLRVLKPFFMNMVVGRKMPPFVLVSALAGRPTCEPHPARSARRPSLHTAGSLLRPSSPAPATAPRTALQSDESVPQNMNWLSNPALLAWHGVNIGTRHRKLHPIPLGLNEARNAAHMARALEEQRAHASRLGEESKLDRVLINFKLDRPWRTRLWELSGSWEVADRKPYVRVAPTP